VLWHAANADQEKIYLDVLTKAFADLGYVDQKNIRLLHKFPAENPERFRTLARELVEDKVDVIIAVTELGAKEVKRATNSIPAIVVLSPDPIRAGLVESLAHPGGNLTGLSLMNSDLSGKRLSLMHEVIPNLSRIALFTDIGTASSVPAFVEAARVSGLSLKTVTLTDPGSIDVAFSELARDGIGAAIVTGSMMFNERVRVASKALANRVATEAIIAEMVREDGILFSYGQDFPEFFRKAAAYADKILKGAKPADLPVEQPTRFKLVVNMKTARAVGVTIPTSMQLSADEVVE
jgi:putative ABC transport system substrate-binding protein